MQELTINDLPKYSHWPQTLLSSHKSVGKEKNIAEIHREFEVEKWGSLLAQVNESSGTLLIDQVDELHTDTGKQTMAYQNGKLEVCPVKEILQQYYHTLARLFRPHVGTSSAIVDLGCGYGSVLLHLAEMGVWENKPLYAADYSASGVAVAKQVASNHGLYLTTGLCDFTDKQVVKMDIPEGALIFTSYSMFYQRNYPASLLDGLIACKPARIINIEPCYEHYDTDTLWGLLSRRYVEYNDYNLDILTWLRNAESEKRIRLHAVHPLIHGINPLLIASAFEWSPI